MISNFLFAVVFQQVCLSLPSWVICVSLSRLVFLMRLHAQRKKKVPKKDEGGVDRRIRESCAGHDKRSTHRGAQERGLYISKDRNVC